MTALKCMDAWFAVEGEEPGFDTWSVWTDGELDEQGHLVRVFMDQDTAVSILRFFNNASTIALHDRIAVEDYDCTYSILPDPMLTEDGLVLLYSIADEMRAEDMKLKPVTP